MYLKFVLVLTQNTHELKSPQPRRRNQERSSDVKDKDDCTVHVFDDLAYYNHPYSLRDLGNGETLVHALESRPQARQQSFNTDHGFSAPT